MANYRQIGLLIAILAIMAIVGYASVTTTYNDLGLSAEGNYTLNSTGYVILNGDRGNNATYFNAKNITADNITVSGYVMNDSSKLKVSDEGLLVAINFNSDTVSDMTAYDVTGRGNNGSSNQQYLNNSGFNGGGYLNFSNNSAGQGFNFSTNLPALKWNYNDSFTISIWINPHRNPDNKFGVASISYKYGMDMTNAGLFFGVRQGGSLATASTKYIVGEWQQFVGVYDADTRYVKLYRNGELKSSTNGSGINFTVTSGTFILGVPVLSANGQGFFGGMDNFMVWNRTLTAEEIRSLYETRFEPSNNLIGKVIDVSTINSTTSTSNTYTAVQNISAPSITGTDANITNINSTQSTSNRFTAVQNISAPVITGVDANITNINTTLLTLNELNGNNYTNIHDVNNNTGYYTYYIHSEAEEIIARSIMTASVLNVTGEAYLSYGSNTKFLSTTSSSTTTVLYFRAANRSVMFEARLTSDDTLQINRGVSSNTYLTFYPTKTTSSKDFQVGTTAGVNLFITNPGETIFAPSSGYLTVQGRGPINISSDSNDNDGANVRDIIFSIGNKTQAAFLSRTGREADLMIYGNVTAGNISANNVSATVITGTNLNVTNIDSTQSSANRYTAIQNITSPVITGTNANITNINSTQSNTNKMNALNASVGDLWVGAGRIYHNGTHLVIQG